MNFRYNFDKSSNKYLCPKCNKRSFVGYIDSETNQLMSLRYGKCDRQSKCGFIATPKGSVIKTTEYVYKEPKTISYHKYNLVSQSGRGFSDNNFIQFLKTVFNEEDIKKVILKYLIGTSKHWNGATVFWQIDNNEKVRHGKVMLYDVNTGKRKKNKNGKAFITSVKSLIKEKNFNLCQCLFGLHLIAESDSKEVAIVESEKTAIIMSVFKPEYIWLATGSVSGFKYEYLKPIRDYKIIAFPDKTEYNNWLNKAIDLNALGFDIAVSDCIEKLECEKGTDLADIFLDNIENVQLVEEKNIESSEKNIENEIIQTNTDLIVLKLAKQNHNLIKLIDVFDLTDKNGLSLRT
ncbi:DUF6371 domain-containing protein [Lacinutrix himadriensis]|uniref:DUF6371 domain-containing protein n=1 Tax=Lacinutrix himadriensis TaxID=641549 RepID=UPI000AA4F043|nr:DUF6371 domain-containing protein [Lacinutrix himadriensis]